MQRAQYRAWLMSFSLCPGDSFPFGECLYNLKQSQLNLQPCFSWEEPKKYGDVTQTHEAETKAGNYHHHHHHYPDLLLLDIVLMVRPRGLTP
jgi:hypothetical protein